MYNITRSEAITMNYVTTNIRISEEDYLRLKAEAAKKRKSFSAMVRERLTVQNKHSELKMSNLWERRGRVAANLGKKFKDFDIVKALREMRYEGKW